MSDLKCEICLKSDLYRSIKLEPHFASEYYLDIDKHKLFALCGMHAEINGAEYMYAKINQSEYLRRKKLRAFT